MLNEMTAAVRGEHTATWLETLADAHERRAVDDPLNESFHRGIAILYRARANDVRAGMDIP